MTFSFFYGRMITFSIHFSAAENSCKNQTHNTLYYIIAMYQRKEDTQLPVLLVIFSSMGETTALRQNKQKVLKC